MHKGGLMRAKANNPQELERLLVARQREGDLDGMVALYEPGAVLDDGSGTLAVGHLEIRRVFSESIGSGKKFALGDQSPALISGDLALTSTRLGKLNITAEVARKQPDGDWLWVIDKFSVS